MQAEIDQLNDNIMCLNATNMEQWACKFVELKMEFARNHQLGFIFSTRFGANFFQETLDYVISGKFIKPENGVVLGLYDQNFNKWLSCIRK